MISCIVTINVTIKMQPRQSGLPLINPYYNFFSTKNATNVTFGLKPLTARLLQNGISVTLVTLM